MQEAEILCQRDYVLVRCFVTGARPDICCSTGVLSVEVSAERAQSSVSAPRAALGTLFLLEN